jgi:predicted Ser/Thr protein kinase
MRTIQIELDDNLYEDITKSGIDIKEKFKEFLMDFADDGYPSISTREAKKRVSEAIEDYQKNGIKNFSVLDNAFWDDTEKRLLDKHKAS